MPAEVIKDNLNVLVELLYKLLSGSGRQEIPADLKRRTSGGADKLQEFINCAYE